MGDKEPEVDKKDEGTGEKGEKDLVTLSRKDYEELLNKLSSIEAQTQLALSKREEVLEEENLEKERGEEEGEIDFSSMSQKDVVDFVAATFFQPLAVALETMRIKNEIREVEREYKDAEIKFKDVKDEVKDLCLKHPKMSVEEAYLQVVATKKKDILRGEQKKTQEPPKSEKGGISSAAAKKEESFKTIKEAAMKAYEELVKE